MTPDERSREIARLEGATIDRLLHSASKIAKSPAPAAEKRIRIIEIAERLSRAISPHTACANGCSHCCHYSVLMTAYEARLIGRHVGREPRYPGRKMGDSHPGLADELGRRYREIACPFLGSRSCGCSIYPVRPFACRIHHTLMDDPETCRIRLDEAGRPVNETKTLNLSVLVSVSAAIFKGEDFGDIREFFPPGGEPGSA